MNEITVTTKTNPVFETYSQALKTGFPLIPEPDLDRLERELRDPRKATAAEVARTIRDIASAWPWAHQKISPEIVDGFVGQLRESLSQFPGDILAQMVTKARETLKFTPSIAELCDVARGLMSDRDNLLRAQIGAHREKHREPERTEQSLILEAENALNGTGDREWRERDRIVGYLQRFASHPKADLILKMLARKVNRYAPQNLDCLPDESVAGLLSGYAPDAPEDEPYWVRDWQDPAKIRSSVAKLDGHPLRSLLGRNLGALVRRHAPQNIGYLPAEWQDPSK